MADLGAYRDLAAAMVPQLVPNRLPAPSRAVALAKAMAAYDAQETPEHALGEAAAYSQEGPLAPAPHDLTSTGLGLYHPSRPSLPPREDPERSLANWEYATPGRLGLQSLQTDETGRPIHPIYGTPLSDDEILNFTHPLLQSFMALEQGRNPHTMERPEGLGGRIAAAGAALTDPMLGGVAPVGAVLGPAGALGSFGGKLARTADLGKLKLAQAMVKDKVPPFDIWQETGWFKGADKKWRFEIPDQGAQIDLDELARFGETGVSNTKFLLPHPELEAAYPRIHRGYYVEKTPGAGGYFSPDKIGLGADLATYDPATGLTKMHPQQARSALLHELGGHGVQYEEGFANGSSTAYVAHQLARKQYDLLRKRAEELLADPEVAAMKYRILAIHARRDQGSATPEEILEMERLRADPRIQEARKSVVLANGLVEKMKQPDGAVSLFPREHLYDLYKRSAGEVEARNVQTRKDYSPLERSLIYPRATEDVPAKRQIVEFMRGGREALAQELALGQLPEAPGLVQALESDPGQRLAGPPGTRGLVSPHPLASPRIAQRLPTAPGATEDPYTQNLLINEDVMAHDPEFYRRAADTIATYPDFPNWMRWLEPKGRFAAYGEQMRNNLKLLHAMTTEPERELAAGWYPGMHRLTGERAAEVGISHPASVAAYAGQSPMTDWDVNVYQGDQVLRILAQDPRVDPDMIRFASTLPEYRKPHIMATVRRLEGKRLSEMDTPDQAVALRLYDELYGPGGYPGNPQPRVYHRILPSGEYGDIITTKSGEPGRPGWAYWNNLERGIAGAKSGGDTRIISDLMSDRHKIRGFYNNGIAPWEGVPMGDFTGDTHAIAAAHLSPFTGSSPQVRIGMGGPPGSSFTGARGTYGWYADQYRQVADELGISPRALQSIGWDKIRKVFTPEIKHDPILQMQVDRVWRSYANGEITQPEAQRRILTLAGQPIPGILR